MALHYHLRLRAAAEAGAAALGSHVNLIVLGSTTTAFEPQAGCSCRACHCGLGTALPLTSM